MTLYQCEICARSFKRNEHLTRHKRSHYSDRPFTCPVCVRSFTRQDSLLRHLSSHAKAPTQSGSQSRLEEAVNNKDKSEPSNEPDQAQQYVAVITEPRAANAHSFDDDDMFGIAEITPEAKFEPEPDLEIPPELFNPPDDADGFNQTPSILERFPSHSAAERSSPIEASRHNYRSNSQVIDPTSPKSLSGSFEWPPALYSNTVDRHARNWLRDLCSEK